MNLLLACGMILSIFKIDTVNVKAILRTQEHEMINTLCQNRTQC